MTRGGVTSVVPGDTILPGICPAGVAARKFTGNSRRSGAGESDPNKRFFSTGVTGGVTYGLPVSPNRRLGKV